MISTPNLIPKKENSRIHLRIEKESPNRIEEKRGFSLAVYFFDVNIFILVNRCPECDFLYNSKCMNSEAEHKSVHESRLNALKIRSGSVLGAKWVNWKSGSIYSVADKHKCKHLQ